jgi:hypothetical protein
MPTILIISRYFPPIASAGASIRLTKLIKYASLCGWNFIVLTQDPDRPVIPEKKLSGFLLEELPKDLNIQRIPNPLFNRTGISGFLGYCFGKSSLPWGIFVCKSGLEQLKKEKIDFIFVNTPPFTNVAVGAVLSKLSGLPLFIDFKDDWVGSQAFLQKGKLRQFIEAWIEKIIIKLASGVFIVTEQSYMAYTQRYEKDVPQEHFQFIPNGLDLEEYKILENRPKQIASPHFTLLTAAAGFRKDYRDLTPLITALNLFFERCPEAKDRFELIFLGEEPDTDYESEFKKIRQNAFVTHKNAVGRQEMVEWLWKADLFFLIQPYGNLTSISGTLYEYWATGKAPILLISEEGASSALVENNQLGEHFLFEQVLNISLYIEKVYKAYVSQEPVWILRNGIQKYDRKNLVNKMLSAMQELSSNKEKK